MNELDELLRRIELLSRLPQPAECRRLREAAGLTRQDVAGLVGVTATAIYAWEHGKSRPAKQHIEAYVELLDRLQDR